MSSLINPSTIDVTYPVAGQNNSSQGFRTNWISIQNNFTETAAEINDIINKTIVSAPLIYGANSNINNFGGMGISNATLLDNGNKIYNHGTITTSGTENFDFTTGSFHEINLAGTGSLTTIVNPTNFPSLGYSELTVYITATNTSHNLSFSSLTFQNSNTVSGFNSTTNTITFTETGPHTLTLGSPDGTNWILSRKNSIGIARTYTPTTSIGILGDTKGQIAYSNTNIYICTANYDGSTSIWVKGTLTSF